MPKFIHCYDYLGSVYICVGDIVAIEISLPDPDCEDDEDLTCITLRSGREIFVMDPVDSVYKKILVS